MAKLLTEGIGHTEFKDTEIGRIPKGWKVVKLKDIATVHYGKSPKGIKIDCSAIPIYGTGGCVGFSETALFKGPLTVVARKGSLNKPIYCQNSCWVIDTAYAVIGNNEVNSKWLYFNFQNYDLSSLNEATGVPSINRDVLYNIKFHIPPLQEQQQIASILSSVDDKIDILQSKKSAYTTLKKGLMAELLTGQMRVKTDLSH